MVLVFLSYPIKDLVVTTSKELKPGKHCSEVKTANKQVSSLEGPLRAQI